MGSYVMDQPSEEEDINWRKETAFYESLSV
jgi:hypothetical protein